MPPIGLDRRLRSAARRHARRRLRPGRHPRDARGGLRRGRLQALRIPTLLRPAFGGLVVGALAIWNSSVFSAGHGAINLYLGIDTSLLLLAAVLVAK
ncbi:chloride channel protein, partial [Bosea thiooxidans]